AGEPNQLGELNAVTCRDFQRKWDEVLDAETQASAPWRVTAPGSSELESKSDSTSACEDWTPALMEHAARCPACRHLDARYRVWLQALGGWHRPPVPPAGLADRVVAAARGLPRSGWRAAAVGRRLWRRKDIMILAAAAATVAMALPLLRMLEHDQPN